MTTKDQERKALEEIRAIVEKVGGDQSYIGMAFKGCFDLAEQNIINDFGESWMDRWSSAINGQNKISEDLRKAQQEAKDLKEELDITYGQLNTIRDARDQWQTIAKEKGEQLLEKSKDLTAAKDEIDELQRETITLKAKLYDLMTA